MPTKKKETEEEKLIVRQFKDGSHNWWCAMKHWTILDGVLVLAAGGADIPEERHHMEKYLKNKKLL